MNGKDETAPDIATQIMAAMVRMPPKPHDEMKLGKRKAKAKPSASPKKRRRPAPSD